MTLLSSEADMWVDFYILDKLLLPSPLVRTTENIPVFIVVAPHGNTMNFSKPLRPYHRIQYDINATTLSGDTVANG